MLQNRERHHHPAQNGFNRIAALLSSMIYQQHVSIEFSQAKRAPLAHLQRMVVKNLLTLHSTGLNQSFHCLIQQSLFMLAFQQHSIPNCTAPPTNINQQFSQNSHCVLYSSQIFLKIPTLSTLSAVAYYFMPKALRLPLLSTLKNFWVQVGYIHVISTQASRITTFADFAGMTRPTSSRFLSCFYQNWKKATVEQRKIG